MIEFERILFPVDFSPQSHAAAPFVQAMASRFRSEVLLLHVVEVPPAWYGSPEPGEYNAVIDLSAMLEDRRVALQKYFLNERGEFSVQRCVQSGDPAWHIAHYARQKNVGLIMMPTHGYGPFRSLLLGSVTAKVLHDLECPVWTTAHAPEIVNNAEKPLSKLICAVDDDPKELPLVRWAAEFAATQKAELRLIHAVNRSEEELGPDVDDPLREFLFDVARERIGAVQSEAGTKFELSLAAGAPGKVVRNFAIDTAADLVLVGRGKIQKQFGRLRSHAYAILRQAPCPVISV